MINCKKCNKQITDSKDVNVLALFGIIPTIMCNNCYASSERGVARHYIYYPKWMPLNSTLFTVLLIISTIIFLGIIIAIIFGQKGKALIPLLILVGLGWQWILWFIAKSKMNKIKTG